jgi:EAL domain-containing protein (putative c-di-GMP-specific phosphodiesterase class I)
VVQPSHIKATETADLMSGLAQLLRSSWPAMEELERDRLLADLVGAAARLRRLLGSDAERADGPAADVVTASLDRFPGAVYVQPIVWLPTREVVGFEALTRFGQWPPERWFRRAWEEGIGLEFELTAVRQALDLLGSLPPDVYLAVNVSPPTILSSALRRLLADTDAARVVLELTEHERITAYDVYRRHLRRLRELDVRVAIDDAGAGHSSLRHIVQLAPDIIKLDRSLVADCDRDPVRRSLMTCLATFATQTKSRLVAEGVETEGESSALVSYGIAFGQGFLFGAPTPEPRLRVDTVTGGWVVAPTASPT